MSVSQRDALVKSLNEVDIQRTKEVIAANKSVLDEQIAADKRAVEDVATTVSKQSELFKSGSTQRIEVIAAGIAQLKVMQDNLAAGKTALGGVEPPEPVGPTSADDSRLRIEARQNEAATVARAMESMFALLGSGYREETNEVSRQILEQERLRTEAIVRGETSEDSTVEAAKRTTTELVRESQDRAESSIAAERKSTDERVREIDRMASYDLITFNQRIVLSRQAYDEEQASVTASTAQRIESVKEENAVTLSKIEDEAIKRTAIAQTLAAEEMVGKTLIEQDAIQETLSRKREAIETEVTEQVIKANEIASAKITELQRQLEGAFQTLAEKRKQLDDDATNHEIQNAEKAANVIALSFNSAFDRMVTTHTSFLATMTRFWDEMVLGFAKMGVQILANWIKTLATQLLYTIVSQTQQTAAVAAGQTAQTASVITGQSAQLAATLAGETGKTAAATTGASARSGVGLIADLKSIGEAAATAAAHSFKWVMEEVPYPANLALAPAAAAATFAAVIAFRSLASAEHGAVLSEDTLVAAHAKEMFLPPDISTGLQNVINTGAIAPSPINFAFPGAYGGRNGSGWRIRYRRRRGRGWGYGGGTGRR